ncbi:MAG: FAD-binding oxidoreductase [Rhodobacteraceae bacterium]|nr:FAD-binding oxidoreductase [Paracoccaceae bacterium]
MTKAAYETRDVVIIGAGIVGICCAISALERGLKVTIIDPAEPASGASHGNAGVISPWSCIPQSTPGLWKKIPGMLLDRKGPLSVAPSYLPSMAGWGFEFLKNCTEHRMRAISEDLSSLTSPSVDLYRQLLAGTGEEYLIQESCYLHAFRTASDADPNDIAYRVRAEKGADIQLLDADQIRDLEPDLAEEFNAAILMPGQARALSPGRVGKVLMQKAIAMGGRFLKAKVTNLSPIHDCGWSIQAGDVDLGSKKVVIAAGAWSRQLLYTLGIKVPLVGERGYHVEFPNSDARLKNSIMDMDWKVVASSMEDGLRIAGTAEFSDLDAPENSRRYKDLIDVAGHLFKNLNTSGVRCWMGTRPSFPDSLPILGPFDGHEGLFGAFGHSHYGFMSAPKSGQLIGDMLIGRVPNISLEGFSAGRFT